MDQAAAQGTGRARKYQLVGLAFLHVAWFFFLYAMFVPVYRGEFLTPGSLRSVNGATFVFGPMAFALHAIVSFPPMIPVALPFFLLSAAAVGSFLLTPLALSKETVRRRKLMLSWVAALALGAFIGAAYLASGGFNLFELRPVAYLIPLAWLLAAPAVYLLHSATVVLQSGLAPMTSAPSR